MKKRLLSYCLYLTFLLLISVPTSAQSFDWYGYFQSEEINKEALILDIITDENGNAYTCGGYSGTADYDIGPAVMKRTSSFGNDYFIAKYDSLGQLIWTLTRSSNFILNDFITRIKVDKQHNVYGIGYDEDDPNKFIVKVSPTGQLVWKQDFHRADGPLQKAPLAFFAIEIDHEANLVALATINDSLDIDPGTGVVGVKPTGDFDLLMLKFSPAGQLLWSQLIGSNDESIRSQTIGRHIIIDTANNIWISGSFKKKVDFDPGPGTYYLETAGMQTPFLAKYTEQGDFLWAKQATNQSSSEESSGGQLFSKETGEIYWTFPYRFIYDPDNLSDTILFPNVNASPLLKLRPDGQLERIFKIGTKEGVGSYYVYPNGEILAGGMVKEGTDIDPAENGLAIKGASSTWASPYMMKYDKEGNYLWSRLLGEGFNASYTPFAADDKENIYFASYFSSYVDLVGEEDMPIPRYQLNGSLSRASYIMKYKKLDCTGLETDYIVPDNNSDSGVEPNTANVPYWKSPSLYNAHRPGGQSYPLFFNETHVNNFLHVAIRSEGCTTNSNSKVALYFAIGDQAMQSPGPWEIQYADINGQSAQISGKLGDMEIPPLYKNEEWQAAIDIDLPVNPNLFSGNTYTINLFARIESDVDPAVLTGSNILKIVAANNNIAWKVFQVYP